MWYYILAYLTAIVVTNAIISYGIRKGGDEPNPLVFVMSLIWPVVLLWFIAIAIDTSVEMLEDTLRRKHDK